MSQRQGIERFLWLLIAALVAAIVLVALYWSTPDEPLIDTHTQLPLAAAPVGGDFSLSREGDSFALSDYRGQVVLLYFGYTFCPDVCPTSLALMRQALRELSPEQLAQVQGVFVSVDPQRDTPERLAEYTRFFHPRIMGVSGSEAQLAEAGRLYGAAWARAESDSAMGYSVDHSSSTYVIDRTGKLVSILPHGASAQRIIETVLPLINNEE